MKKIVKWFIPSSSKLSQYASEAIQKCVNSSGKEELIAKYGDMSDKAASAAKWLTEMLKDGKIDDLEKEDIQEHLKPLFEKLMELI